MSYFSKINPIYFPTDQTPFDGITEHQAANEYDPDMCQVFLDTDSIILQARIPVHASGSAFTAKVDGITYAAPLVPMQTINGYDYHTLSIPLSSHTGKIIYVNAFITDNNVSGTPQTIISWPIEVMSSTGDCAKFYRRIEYSGKKLAFLHWFDGSIVRPSVRINARISFVGAEDIDRETISTPDFDTLVPYSGTASIYDLLIEYLPLWMIEKLTYITKLPDVLIDGLAVLQESPLRPGQERESHENALFQSDMQVRKRTTENILTPY